MEVSNSDIQSLRSAFFEKLEESGLSDADAFHPADVSRAKTSDEWLKRFLVHHENDMKEALNMLWETCDWRKKFGTNDINERNINMDIINGGSLYSHNVDRDGKALLIFKSKKHVKGNCDFEQLKRCLVYWMERLERERNGDCISVFFDMDGAGLTNMDMEYTKYVISLFKCYYPNFLNNIYIFEMAWILNAAFKIIKTWLPPKAVQKIKFLSKSSLKEFVDSDNALKSWGGSDDYTFEFIPEATNQAPPPVVEVERKKVHFADRSPVSESSSTIRSALQNTMLNISPHDVIAFKYEGTELTGAVTLRNDSSGTLSFKIKTTSPEKFRVRPCYGILPSGATVSIHVVLLPGCDGPGLARDKFLVMSVPVQAADLPNLDLTELWKNAGSEVVQHRLYCSVPSNTISENIRNGAVQDSDRQLSKLSSEISKLHTELQSMSEEVRRIQIQQWVVLIMLFLLTALTFYLSRSETTVVTENQSCFAPPPPPQP